MKNKILGIVFVCLVLLTSINAQEDSFVSDSDIQSQFSDPSVKLSFRSWGEGRETTVTLDEYFLGERERDDRYLEVSPAEIDITINQETGIATLKSRGKWIGTRDVIFTRSTVYDLEKSLNELKEFESELVKKRIPPKIKNEFVDIRDTPAFYYLEKILDNLESKKTKKTTEVNAKLEGNRLVIEIGKDIDMSIGVETEFEGIKTRKPEILVNVRPGEEPEIVEEQEESQGLPILVLFPLILIGGTLLVAFIIYLKNSHTKIKIVPKIKQTKPEIIAKNIEDVEKYKSQIKDILSKINSLPIEQSSEKSFELIKNFFNTLTNPSYEFTYSEVTKEILDKELNKPTENFLIKFSKELEHLRYSNKSATKEGIKEILSKTKKGIDLSIIDLRKKHSNERVKLSEKNPILKLIVDTKNYFKGEKSIADPKTRSIFKRILAIAETTPEDIETKTLKKIRKIKGPNPKTFRNFLHYLGLTKTSEEIEKIKDNKRRIAIAKEKSKLRIIEEKKKQRIKEKAERRRAIKKFFHDNFGLYKTDRDIELAKKELLIKKQLKEKLVRQIKLEKENIKKHRKEEIKKFFRDYFGFFKTKEEIEKELKEKFLEERRRKLAKKRAVIKFFHDNFGIFKTNKEIKEEKENILEAKLEKEKLKERIIASKKRASLARKQAIKQFFHNNFGLFKTHEEKEEIIRTRYEEKRKKQLERKKAIYNFFHQTLGIKTQKEKEEIKLKKGQLKLKVLREKRRLKAERKESIRKLLHDTLGLYKTEEEKENEEISRLKEKREKSIARRKTFIKYCHDKLGLFKTKNEIQLEKERKEKLKIKLHKEKIKTKLAKRKIWRKFLHDKLGLLKTPKELSQIKAKEKAKRERKEERKIRNLRIKLEKKELRRKHLKKLLHDKLGLYKTKSELKKIKLQKEIEKERNEKERLLKVKDRLERNKSIREFLHDNLGLFKTYEERKKLANKKREESLLKEKLKIKKAQQLKIKKLQIKNKIIEKTGFIKKFFKKDIVPSDEIHILIKLEEEAIRKGQIKKAKKFQKIINKKYSRIKFQRTHPKISQIIAKINKPSLKNLFKNNKKDNNSIDEINFLLKRCEKSLTTKRNKDAQELFIRATNIYKKLNNTSKEAIEKNILTVRSEIASITVKASLEKAHEALRNGEIKKAKSLYKRIKDNFYYLPTKHKETLLEHKNSLSQKLQKRKKKFIISLPRIPLPEFNLVTLFNLEKEKIVDKLKSFNKDELKYKKENNYQEPLKNYFLAKKPKFISITTDTIPLKQTEKNIKRRIKEITNHISHTNKLIAKKDHQKAKEKYKNLVSLFKEYSHELPVGFHKTFEKNIKPLKEKILHVSLSNLLLEIPKAIKKGEHETAKELQNKVKSIYAHISKNNVLPFTPPSKNVEKLNILIENTSQAISKKDYKKATELYNKITNKYALLSKQQQEKNYSKILKIYKELLKN